jgi:hypothetical protein
MKKYCKCGNESDILTSTLCKKCRSESNKKAYLKRVPNAYFWEKKSKIKKIKTGLISSVKSEIWKDVVGYSGSYMVSNFGRVKSLSRDVPFINRWGQECIRIICEKLLNQSTSHKGYARVHLHNAVKTKAFSVHRLVCIAFLANEYKYPSINHKDGNKLNNKIDNLEWCSHSQNQNHAVKMGLNVAKKGFEDSQSKPVIREKTNQVFGSINLGVEYLGIPKTTLSRAAKSGKKISRGPFKGEIFKYYANHL